MTNQPKHTVLITRLLLVVLLLTSSGFTTVLRECTMMNDASGPMDCCMPSRTNDESRANSSTSPATTSIAQIDCHIATIVGGLPATSGIIEKNSNSILPKLVDLSVTIEPGILSDIHLNGSTAVFFLFEPTLSIFPDKRLLHSSLLI